MDSLDLSVKQQQIDVMESRLFKSILNENSKNLLPCLTRLCFFIIIIIISVSSGESKDKVWGLFYTEIINFL